jgi:hypothetical protein
VASQCAKIQAPGKTKNWLDRAYSKFPPPQKRAAHAAICSHFPPAAGFIIIGVEYWHHNFGQRMSHGCVELPTAAAGRLYCWAPNGTVIRIHY